jgi:thiamine-monophosphate kinase
MESEFITWLRQRLPKNSSVRLGLGDDAAVLALRDSAGCIVTSDMLTDGVDFILDDCDPRRVGRKALAVNLSDLAAMAARPIAAIISVVVPRDGGLRLAMELYEGLLPLAAQFDVAIAGGDTNSWDGPLVISITAIGEEAAHGIWTRGGAKLGDQVLVTGTFGGSILGKHFDFQPRVHEALELASCYRINAATDVSDGLSLDLSHILEESNCGVRLDFESIPISEAASELAASQSSSVTALEHALSDGEDFELILTAPSNEAERMLNDQPLDVPLTRIGEIIDTPGLWRETPSGSLEAIRPSGYEH